MNERAQGPMLITGAEGMLGTAWRELLAERGIAHTATDRGRLDILDRAAVDAAVSGQSVGGKPAAVINCAAYTDVDGAEDDADAATALNGTAVGYLADACAANDVLLVHYSTDYVFNGHDTTAYVVDAPREPINAYGASKAVGERLIEESGCEHLTVRTSWLYAAWGKNFVRTILRLAATRDELEVVNDQRGRPTEAGCLARTTLALIEAGHRGFAHATDTGECSWFEFAHEIVKLAGLPCTVAPCGTEAFPRPAPRPSYSVLDIADTERVVGLLPHWTINLERTLRALGATKD
jgi:dTDP-4-dehydrorhamnose reductase